MFEKMRAHLFLVWPTELFLVGDRGAEIEFHIFHDRAHRESSVAISLYLSFIMTHNRGAGKVK